MTTNNKKFIKLGIMFIIVGLLGLSIPLISIGVFRENKFIAGVADNSKLQTTPAPIKSTATPSIDPNAPSVKNRLVIPGANINMALIQSKTEKALWRGGWVFPTGSTPDQGGNTVIFGHRFRYLPPVSNTLYNLDKVFVDDTFYVTWNGPRYDYKVSEIKIIDPKDLYVLDPSSESQITLITCFPLFSTKQRLVVIGDLIAN